MPTATRSTWAAPGSIPATFAGGLTIETLFTLDPSYNSENDLAEFFRKEDGGNRILLCLQNPGNISGGTTAGIAFGLYVGGYTELDIPFDGLNGRPTVANVADGKLHRLAATYDPATGIKSLYLDGVLLGTEQRTPGTAINSGGGAGGFIGSLNGSGEPFDGIIDEMAIYNRPLSAAEIRAHVAATKGLLANDTGTPQVTAVNGNPAGVGSAITLASGAKVTVRADGNYTYDPNGQFGWLAPGQSATDSFSYTVGDPIPASARGDLVAHLRADRGVSTVGTTVALWGDQSAVTGGNHATQPLATQRPQLVRGGLNGLDVIRFSGTQQLVLPNTGTLGILNSDYEIFIVGRSSTSAVQFLSAGGVNETYELHLDGSAGARFIPNSYNGGVGTSDIGAVGAYTNGQPHVFNMRVDGNTGVLAVDGVTSTDVVAGGARSAADTPLILGRRGSGSYATQRRRRRGADLRPGPDGGGARRGQLHVAKPLGGRQRRLGRAVAEHGQRHDHRGRSRRRETRHEYRPPAGQQRDRG